VIFDAVSE
jgi:hypothetical protein